MHQTSTKPYKGSRDFYPPDKYLHNYIFSKARQVVERFGFEEVDAPLIEPLELYLLKTSEEIVNQQIYSFEDKGGRNVAIRPEMTPSIARMVAKEIHNLTKPIKWYSIPNVWRYEQPGKGRLREHWQLNADIFGTHDILWADAEILSIAIDILTSFNSTNQDFTVKLHHREILNSLFKDILHLDKKQIPSISRIMDKYNKISTDKFEEMLKKEGLSHEQIQILKTFLTQGDSFLSNFTPNIQMDAIDHLNKIIEILAITGKDQFIQLDTSIIRGFDYYTGMVFEVFDIDPSNRRSLFGGGRYDKLVGQITKQECNAVGFGMGDVTLQNFLEIHQLLPKIKTHIQVYVASFNTNEDKLHSHKIAHLIRQSGINVETTMDYRKLSNQYKTASDKKIPFVVLQGEEERKLNLVKVKDMKNKAEQTMALSDLVSYLKSKLLTN